MKYSLPSVLFLWGVVVCFNNFIERKVTHTEYMKMEAAGFAFTSLKFSPDFKSLGSSF